MEPGIAGSSPAEVIVCGTLGTTVGTLPSVAQDRGCHDTKPTRFSPLPPSGHAKGTER